MVLGAGGVVGFHLSSLLAEKHTVITAARRSKGADFHLDVANHESLRLLIKKCSPDAVINAVKPPLSVDQMEVQQKQAYLLNTALPEALARYQRQHGFALVQISTDGVYAGGKGKQYNEKSLTYPKNYYCYTKALAEERIMAFADRYLILRTEGVFGYDLRGSNFFMRLKSSAEKGKVFSAAADQFSQPICGIELARLAGKLLEKGEQGVFNATGRDLLSRYQLAAQLSRAFGWKNKLERSSVASRGVAAQPYLSVDVSKLQSAVGSINSLGAQIVSLKGWMDENFGN